MVLLIVGSLATASMVLAYAMEHRSPRFIAMLAVASAVGAGYGFAIEAWPFGALESVWTVVATQRYLQVRRRSPTMSESDQPLACDMNAMNDVQRATHEQLSATLHGAMQVEPLPDGFAFQFPLEDGIYVRLAEWVSLERLCCPFLRFDLRMVAEENFVELRMTCQEGVRDFLREELGLAS